MKTFDDLMRGDYIYRVSLGEIDMFWYEDQVISVKETDEGKIIKRTDGGYEDGPTAELELGKYALSQSSTYLNEEHGDFPELVFTTIDGLFDYLVRTNASYAQAIEEVNSLKALHNEK